MIFQYYVAITPSGQAGLAATKRSVVEAAKGGKVVAVLARNVFEAQRSALELWDDGIAMR